MKNAFEQIKDLKLPIEKTEVQMEDFTRLIELLKMEFGMPKRYVQQHGDEFTLSLSWAMKV